MNETELGYFVDENLCGENSCGKPQEIISPSGRFRLLIRCYSTKKGGWNYSRGTVYRVTDNVEICDIKRNYSAFHYSFVTKNGEEFLISGRSYMNQTIVNLDRGVEYEPIIKETGGEFCWAESFLSPDGNVLVVDGCYWACPYMLKFFDFSDPSKGWAELELDDEWIDADSKEPDFTDDGHIICYMTRNMYKPLGKYEGEFKSSEIPKEELDKLENWELVVHQRLTLKLEGNKLVVANKWVSEEEQIIRDEREKAQVEYEANIKQFKATDPLYLKCVELVGSYKFEGCSDYWSVGFTYDGWCNEKIQEQRWCRRILEQGEDGYTVDLEWAKVSGPIKLVIFKGGNKLEDKFFDHSAASMIQALEYTSSLVTKS